MNIGIQRQMVFKCPRTGINVQHRLEYARPECSEPEGTHVSVCCPAWRVAALGQQHDRQTAGRLERAGCSASQMMRDIPDMEQQEESRIGEYRLPVSLAEAVRVEIAYPGGERIVRLFGNIAKSDRSITVLRSVKVAVAGGVDVDESTSPGAGIQQKYGAANNRSAKEATPGRRLHRRITTGSGEFASEPQLAGSAGGYRLRVSTASERRSGGCPPRRRPSPPRSLSKKPKKVSAGEKEMPMPIEDSCQEAGRPSCTATPPRRPCKAPTGGAVYPYFGTGAAATHQQQTAVRRCPQLYLLILLRLVALEIKLVVAVDLTGTPVQKPYHSSRRHRMTAAGSEPS